ncbi:zinc-ribbon domain-containing protein [Maribacter sp. 2-571]|uniref:zinc-ribbon domain-containing protein n=1 Tax=Maribacter sp. 2-571 TaxID=3417569 RepID=UPI003D327953
MIIYGSKAVHLKSKQSKTTTCPNCRTIGSVVLSVYRRHAHIFWIPLFPIGKKGVSQCQHCKNLLKINEMPEPIKREYNALKKETKGPIWQFTGPGILTALVAWGVYAEGERKKRDMEYISAPMKGDIYEYKVASGSYSTLKVTRLSHDSVFVSPNDYEISKKSGLHTIDKSENYSDSIYGISKNELREMYGSGVIFNIGR